MCSNAGDPADGPEADAPGADAPRTGAPGAGALDRLGSAIESLAQAAREEGTPAREIAERLARAWELVADLDPEIAERLAQYDC